MSADRPLGSRLNYAQCWEDPRLLHAVLEPGEGRHLLSIASAGDNALALALRGARVTAVDLSAPQIACAELKVAGRHLALEDYRRLLGLDPGGDRHALYRGVRPYLSEASRGFWDDQGDLIEAGILHHGRFERYLATFRRRVLPLIHRRSTVRGWFDLADLAAQRAYYEERWDSWRWRALFRVFFSQRVMAALGRSPEQFAHVQGPVGAALLERARHVLTAIPLRDNGYVQWMLAGAWLHPEARPAYLTEQGFARLDEAADRLDLHHRGLDEHLAGCADDTYDGCNLSNLFEYLEPGHAERLLAALARVGRPGARLAYWNLFVPRTRPECLADRLRPLPERGAALLERDRAFVYGAFVVEEVR